MQHDALRPGQEPLAIGKRILYAPCTSCRHELLERPLVTLWNQVDIDFAEELSIWGAQAEGDADASLTSNALPMVTPHDFCFVLCKTKLSAAGYFFVASTPAKSMLSSWLIVLSGSFIWRVPCLVC